MKHSLKDWTQVTRYWSFAVSAMPVVVTFAYLLSRHLVPSGPEPWLLFALTLLGVVTLHAAGNVLSDWSDYRSGVDNEKASAVPNLVYKIFEPREYLIFSLILFAVGAVIGFTIVAICGLPVLVIGAIGVALTVLYSFLKYRALGDLDIFLIFSVLIMLGTGAVICKEVNFDVLVLAIPVGVITVSVLHANNTFDIVTDGEAGIRTFAMILGGRASAMLYRIYMVVPFITVALAAALGYLNVLSLLCFGAFPIALRNIKAASHFDEKGIATMTGLDQASAKLQTVFSGLLTLGLALSAIIF